MGHYKYTKILKANYGKKDLHEEFGFVTFEYDYMNIK